MGKLWHSNGEGFDLIKRLKAGTGTGSVAVKRIWEQAGDDGGTDWVSVWERPSVPPPAPALQVTLVTATRNKFTVKLTMPSSDVQGDFRRAVVKVGIGKVPNPPDVNDGTYYSQKANAEPWSEWFTDKLVNGGSIPVNHTGSKTFPNEFQNTVNVPLNTDVTFSAWIQDEFGNWSPVASKTVRTLKSTDLPYGGVTYKTVIAPLGFDEWAAKQANWMYRGRTVNNKKTYATPTWSRDTTNNYWYIMQGGSEQRQAYLYFGTLLRQVMNAAYEVTQVTLKVKRRNEKMPNQATEFGPEAGTIMRIWASTPGTPIANALGGTADLIAASKSDINTGTFKYGAVKDIVIPKTTWEHFLNGKGNKAFSLCFQYAGSKGGSADKGSICFTAPGVYNNVAKWAKADMAGYVTVTWVGFQGNPWPTATPGHAQFKPLGVTTW